MPETIVQESSQETPPGSTTETATATKVEGTPGSDPGKNTGQFSYTEDRSKWIPPHRLTEESAKRAKLEADHRAATERLTERERQIAALTGAKTPDPNETQTAEARKALEQMYPGLKKLGGLSDEQIDRLLQTPEFVANQQQAERQQWQTFADTTKESLAGLIAEGIGLDKLSEDQTDDMFEAFRSWTLRRYQTEMDTTGVSQTQTRYERRDPALLKEFSDRYLKNWAEPMRRKVTAQETARTRRVPQSTQHTTASTVQRPQKFKDLDERLDFAAKAAIERGEIRRD